MKMNRSLFVLLVLAAASLPATALAQARFEITPVAGYRLSGKIATFDERDDRFEDTDLEVEESNFYGAVFDIPLGQNWSLELLANRQESSFLLDEGLFDPEERLGDVEISYYHVGLLYQWGRGQVNPFVTAALGLARIEPEARSLEGDDHLSGSLGGGVKVYFSRNVGLRLEGRGYWTSFDSGLSDNSTGRRRRSNDEALYQGEASAGLIFAW
jgi:hypothetical protein